MARSKLKQPVKGGGAGSAPHLTAVPARTSNLTLRDYVVLNVIFSAFCILQLIAVRLLLRDFAGLYFFFIFLMVSFLVVSIFDYISNRIGLGSQLEDNSEVIDD